MNNKNNRVVTKYSQLNETLQAVKTVEYISRKTKGENATNIKKKSTSSRPINSNNAFDIKKAKVDVIKFGLSGLGTKDQKAAKIEEAIKLGAKPPKKEYMNYKTLKIQISNAKKVEDIKSKYDSMQNVIETNKSMLHKQKSKLHKGKRKGPNLLDSYGKVSTHQ